MFILSKLFHILILPPGLFFVLLLCSLYLLLKNRYKYAQYFLITTIILFYLLSIHITKELLAYPLEIKYLEFINPDKSDYDSIIILGGGLKETPTGDLAILSSRSLKRLSKGWEIFKSSQKPIILCGGVTLHHKISEAIIMKTTIMDFNVPQKLIHIEDKSRNTYENIANAKNILGKLHLQKPLVVTSAIHLERVMFFCKHFKINATPCPAEFIIEKRDLFFLDFLPRLGCLSQNVQSLHEYIGLMYARLQVRT